MNNYLRRVGVCVLLGLFCFFLFQNFLYAQEDSEENKLNKKFLKQFKNDFGNVIVSPKHWDKKDVGNFVFICGTGLFLYAIDDDIQQMFKANTDGTSDAAKAITSFGNGAVLAGLIAALYAGGEISDNDSLRKTSLLSLESWLTTGIIVVGMKFVFGRARPGTGKPKNTFYPFTLKSSYNSFPSGHSASAFAVASVIASQTKDANVDLLVYTLATLVGVSRVNNNKHWASDVLIGSVIGHAVGKKICALNRNSSSTKVHLSFQCTAQRQAIEINICF